MTYTEIIQHGVVYFTLFTGKQISLNLCISQLSADCIIIR